MVNENIPPQRDVFVYRLTPLKAFNVCSLRIFLSEIIKHPLSFGSTSVHKRKTCLLSFPKL